MPNKDKPSEQQPSGELVISTLAMPVDTNPNGDIFGGWLVSQMDLGATIMARKRSPGRSATVAIDAMSFLRPVQVGDLVRCYAEIVRVGNTSMAIKIEAWAINQGNSKHTAEPAKVTEGIFTFVAIDKKGKPRPVDG